MTGVSQTFITQERVRWADVDLVGIMRFSAYPRLVEFAEQEMMRAADMPYSQLIDTPDVWMLRRHLAIGYHAPAHLDALLSLVTYVSRIGETSLTFNVDVMSGDCRTLHASAEMVVVSVTAATFTKCTLPAAVRDKLAPFHLSTEAARATLAAMG